MRLENISHAVLSKCILLHVIGNKFLIPLNSGLRILTPNYKTKYTASISVARKATDVVVTSWYRCLPSQVTFTARTAIMTSLD